MKLCEEMGCHVGIHNGSDWPQMGQIWGLLRSVSVHFGSPSQNVLKLILKSPRFVPFCANLTQIRSQLDILGSWCITANHSIINVCQCDHTPPHPPPSSPSPALLSGIITTFNETVWRAPRHTELSFWYQIGKSRGFSGQISIHFDSVSHQVDEHKTDTDLCNLWDNSDQLRPQIWQACIDSCCSL